MRSHQVGAAQVNDGNQELLVSRLVVKRSAVWQCNFKNSFQIIFAVPPLTAKNYVGLEFKKKEGNNDQGRKAKQI